MATPPIFRSSVTSSPEPAFSAAQPLQATFFVTRLFFVPLLLATLPGCGGNGLKLVPVEGKVTLDGQSVAEAGVCFEPIDGGPVGSGTTDATGHFTIHTANRPGAMSGKHYVTITKQKMRGLTPDGSPGPGGVTIEWIVPARYAQTKTSGLTADVGKQTTFRFELTDR